MLGWLRRNGSNGALERGVDLIEAAPTVAQRQDELLSGYLDNDLAPAVREELEVRLATEADLRESLAGMRLVRDTLRTLEPVRAPRSFAIAAPPVSSAPAGVRARVRSTRSRGPVRRDGGGGGVRRRARR